jgi:cytochrome d ubiquinol oxidase subunit I
MYGPGDYIPPVAVVYWTFRIMVGAGILLLGLAIYAVFMVMGEKIDIGPRLKKIFLIAIFLPYLANTAGWLMTEIGRVPWVVQGVMTLEDAVSISVSAGELWVTLIGFTLIYGLLMVADVYLLIKYAKIVPGETEATPEMDDEALSLVGAD